VQVGHMVRLDVAGVVGRDVTLAEINAVGDVDGLEIVDEKLPVESVALPVPIGTEALQDAEVLKTFGYMRWNGRPAGSLPSAYA
jgi:hypothetical protein